MCVTDILFTTLFKHHRIGQDGWMADGRDESQFCSVNKSRVEKFGRRKKNHSHRPLFKLTPLALRFPLRNRVQKLPFFV